MTAFVVTGGTVGCRNGTLRWCDRDDVVGGRADDLSFQCYVYMFIVYSVHMSVSPTDMLSAHTFTPVCKTMSYVEEIELNEMTGNSWSHNEV